MAFTSAQNLDANSSSGGYLVRRGTYVNTAGSTGGEVVTGLDQVFHMTLTSTTGTAAGSQVDEMFPTVQGSMTVVNVADDDGIWEATGR